MCLKKLHTLFLLCFFCLLVFQPGICSAEKTYQITETQLTQLEQIFNQLETNSIQSQTELTTLKAQVSLLNNQLAGLKLSTVQAQNSLQEANKSLEMLEQEIKQERREAQIEKYKYAVYGIIAGLLYGGMK